MRSPHAQAGFTLLETVVAFVIAAGTLTLLYRIHASATTTVALGTEYVFAAELAKSLVAEVGGTENTPRFERSGTVSDKYRWWLRAEPHQTSTTSESTSRDLEAAAAKVEKGGFRLRRIEVLVTWMSRDRERSFELETIRPTYALEAEAL